MKQRSEDAEETVRPITPNDAKPGDASDAPKPPEVSPERAAEDADRRRGDERAGSGAEKDPDDWVTGDEPMTAAQASYLETLSREAGEPFDESLSKADASRRNEELQERTGRGVH